MSISFNSSVKLWKQTDKNPRWLEWGSKPNVDFKRPTNTCQEINWDLKLILAFETFFLKTQVNPWPCTERAFECTIIKNTISDWYCFYSILHYHFEAENNFTKLVLVTYKLSFAVYKLDYKWCISHYQFCWTGRRVFGLIYLCTRLILFQFSLIVFIKISLRCLKIGILFH